MARGTGHLIELCSAPAYFDEMVSGAGHVRRREVNPVNIFRAFEVALRNGTVAAEVVAAPSAMALLHYSYSANPNVVGRLCPLLLVAAHIYMAVMASRRALPLNARALLLRGALLAQSFYPEVPGPWLHGVAPFERRFPTLQQAPVEAWSAVGCEPEGPLTLSGLASNLRDSGAVDCLRGSAVFSPREFFNEAPDASPHDMLRAVRPLLQLRPLTTVMGRSVGHEFFVKDVLRQHLQRLPDDAALLLEFGVGHQARSFRMISRHLQQLARSEGSDRPGPTLAGFDSFRGLPRAWRELPKGAFGPAGGQLPRLLGHHAVYAVGPFNHTVPAFLGSVGAAPRVVFAHLDADLYESTALVLQYLRPHLREGAILIFDDFECEVCGPQTGSEEALDSWVAFFEALKSEDWPWKLEVLAAPWQYALLSDYALRHAAFRLVS